MKLKNYLIPLIFIGGCSSQNESGVTTEPSEAMTSISDEELDYIQAFESGSSSIKQYSPNSGKFIPYDTVVKSSGRYKGMRQKIQRMTGRAFPKYFFLGLNQTDSLRKIIEKINQNTTDPDSMIVGTVVELGFKLDTAANGKVGYRLEPYLIPARRNKSLVTDFGEGNGLLKTTSGSGGLDNSVPCPDDC